MEDTPYTDRTLKIYRMMIEEGYNGAGIVIQTYLYRRKEIRPIATLFAGPPAKRLQRTKSVAFPGKRMWTRTSSTC